MKKKKIEVELICLEKYYISTTEISSELILKQFHQIIPKIVWSTNLAVRVPTYNNVFNLWTIACNFKSYDLATQLRRFSLTVVGSRKHVTGVSQDEHVTWARLAEMRRQNARVDAGNKEYRRLKYKINKQMVCWSTKCQLIRNICPSCSTGEMKAFERKNNLSNWTTQSWQSEKPTHRP